MGHQWLPPTGFAEMTCLSQPVLEIIPNPLEKGICLVFRVHSQQVRCPNIRVVA
jgi:hypothetical protein